MIGVVRQPRVVEARTEMFGPSTVALVEQDDVEPGAAALGGETAHVMRLARAFEAVQREQERTAGAIGLPVTVRQHLRVVGDLEQTRFGCGEVREATTATPRDDGHQVTVAQAFPGNEGTQRSR